MTIALSLRFTVLERDDFTCRFCGRRAPETELEVDHLHPRSKGGSDDPSNLVTACRSCNAGKGDRVLLPAGPNDAADWGSLAGKYFVVFTPTGGVSSEGLILAEPTPGYLAVEWVNHGGDAVMRLVSVERVAAEGWCLFRTARDLDRAKDSSVRVPGVPF